MRRVSLKKFGFYLYQKRMHLMHRIYASSLFQLMNFIYLWDPYTMKQQLHIIIGTSNHTWQANWDIGAFLIKTHLALTQSVENVYLGMLKIKKLIIWQRQTCMAANEVYSNTYTLKLLLKPALTEVQRLEKEATRTLSINSVGLKTLSLLLSLV